MGSRDSVGIEQRALQRRQRADGADLAQVGRDARTLALHPVALRADRLALEQRFAPLGVAEAHRRRRRVEARPDEGDDARELGRLQLEARHAGARDARGDDPGEVVVGRRAPEAAKSQIDARHPVAGGAVTDLALRTVEPLARLHVGARVGVVLGERLRVEPDGQHAPRTASHDRVQTRRVRSRISAIDSGSREIDHRSRCRPDRRLTRPPPRHCRMPALARGAGGEETSWQQPRL